MTKRGIPCDNCGRFMTSVRHARYIGTDRWLCERCKVLRKGLDTEQGK